MNFLPVVSQCGRRRMSDVTFPLVSGPQKAGGLFDMSCLISSAMNWVNWPRVKLLSATSMTVRLPLKTGP